MSDQNRQLYERILSGETPKQVVTGLAYDDPITDTNKIGSTAVSDLKVGGNSINKIAIGSVIVYDRSAQ